MNIKQLSVLYSNYLLSFPKWSGTILLYAFCLPLLANIRMTLTTLWAHVPLHITFRSVAHVRILAKQHFTCAHKPIYTHSRTRTHAAPLTCARDISCADMLHSV